MIIALDTASTTGWCTGPVGAQPPLLAWGSRDFGGTGKTNGEVVATFRAWLNERCFVLKPTLCVFETPYIPIARAFPSKKPGNGPPPMNPLVLRRLLGMTAAIEAVCFELRIPCREAVSAAFTKFVTGKGQYPGGRVEKKAAVIEACRYLGCETLDDDNAADAAALWLFAEGIVSPRASEHRRRLAADRDRALHGAGPLFPTSEKENAPQAVTCEALGQPHGAAESQWSTMSTDI